MMGSALSAVSIFVGLVTVLAPTSAHAEPMRKTHTSGPALGVVAPVGAGLVGVRADYILQMPESNLRAAAHAAVGGPACVNGDCGRASTVFGLTGTWGNRNRIFIEAEVGTVGLVQLRLHDTALDSRLLWGCKAILGYEFMGYSGFFVRFGLGASWLWEPALFSFEDRIGLAATGHIGHKLW